MTQKPTKAQSILSQRKKRPSRSKRATKKSQAPEQPERLKAYGYVRVSTEEQAREGISLDAQEQSIKSYASFMNLELVEILRDEGFSGKDLHRPALEQLIELVHCDESEAVIVYKLDRLTRRTSDLLWLVEEIFTKGNTRFFSITEQIDTDSAMGKFFLTIMGAMAQMERELISERTVAALSFKKEQGDSLGHVPYGYQRVDGKLVEDKEERLVIRRMQRWRREGLSYKKVAERLNEKEIPTKKGGARWHASSVHHILNRTKKSDL